MLGPAIGKICLHSVKEHAEKTCIVKLYGYGGNTVLQLQGIQRGPIGSSFLKIGDTTELSRTMERSFVIYNKGPLNGVAFINVKSKTSEDLSSSSSITITPRNCIILPNSSMRITVTFRPRRNDLTKVRQSQTDVITIATLEVFFGDEPTRQRLSKLIPQLKSENDAYYKSLDFLVKNFENVAQEELSMFNESKVTY